jgi:CHAT domain-containing protein/tetratricopeptide (TPR) repeat protein
MRYRSSNRLLLWGLVLCLATALLVSGSGAPADDPPGTVAERYPGLSAVQIDRLKRRDPHQRRAEELFRAGKLAEAAKEAEAMLAIEREVLGNRHRDVAGSLEMLAHLYAERDRWAAAHKAAADLVEVQTALLGAGRWEVVGARAWRDHLERMSKLEADQLRRLGEAERMRARFNRLFRAERYEEATALARSQMVTCRQILGRQNQAYLQCLIELGRALQAQQNNIGAVPWLEEAVEVSRGLYGERSPRHAAALGRLSDALYLVGDLGRSQALLERGLGIWRELGLTWTAAFVSALEELAKILGETGHPEKARPLAAEALELVRRTVGEKDVRYADELALLGEISLQQKDLDGARRLFEREKALLQQLVGEKHPKFAYCLNYLGRVLQDEGDLDGAKALYEQAIFIFPEQSRYPVSAVKIGAVRYWNGVIHDNLRSLATARQLRREPERARLRSLAAAARGRGDLGEAIRLVTDRVKLLAEDFGVDSDEVAVCLEEEASLRLENADYAGARGTLGRLRELLHFRLNGHWQETDVRIRLAAIAREERLDPAARARLKEIDSLIDKAESHEAAGRHDAAVTVWGDAVRLQKEILGDDHPRTPVLLDRLGMAILHSGNPRSAVPTLGAAMELSQKVIGEQLDDRSPWRSAQELARAKQELGLFHPDTTLKACHLIQAIHALGETDRARNVVQQVVRFRGMADAGDPSAIHYVYDANVQSIGVESTGEQRNLIAGLSDSRPAKDVTANEALLDLQRKLYGPEDPSVAETLDWLAVRHEARQDFEAARRAREESYRLRRRTLGEGHWIVTDAWLALKNVQTLARLGDVQRRYYTQGLGAWNRARFSIRHSSLAEAMPTMQGALAAMRKALGDRHPRYADGLLELGELLRVQGDLIGAEPLLTMALALRQEMMGENHPATARAVFALAKLKADQGRFVESEELIRAASRRLEALIGPRHPDFVDTLDELASVCLKRGRYTESRAAIDLALRTAATDRANRLVHRVGILASLEGALGNHAEARRILERIIKMWERADKPERERFLAGRVEPSQARRMSERLDQALIGGNPERLEVLNTLARSLRDAGDYAGSKAIMERVLSLHYDIPRTEQDRLLVPLDGPRGLSRRHPLYAERLQDLADLCLALGDIDRAASLFEQAAALTEELLGPEHPQYALRLSGRACVLAARHDLDGARRDAERALALSRQAWGEGHPVTTEAARSLARIQLMRGEPGAAKSLLSDQLAATRAAERQSHPDQPGLLSDLADVLITLGETDAARPLLDKALELNDSLLGRDHPANGAILDRLCLWHQAKGDRENARKAALGALELGERYLSRNLSGLSERETLAALGELRSSLANLLDLDGGAAGVYQHLINWKGAALSASRRVRVVDPGRQELILELNRARSRIQEFYYTFPRGPDADDFARDFRELVDRRARLEAELGKAAGWEPRMIKPESVASLLPVGTALVDLFRYTHRSFDPATHRSRSQDHYVAFVIRPDSAPVRLDLGPAEPIDGLIQRWRQRVEFPGSDLRTVGAELARLVWKPLLPTLGGVTTVVVSPDGDLGFLPWGALPDEAPESYLIERYAFGTIVSARQLVEQAQSPATAATEAELLVVGDIDYDHASAPLGPAATAPSAAPAPGDSTARPPAALARPGAALVRSAPIHASQLHFTGLPRTGKEIDDIARVFRENKLGPVRSYSGPDATKGRLVEALPGKRYIHLATHGYFAPPGTRSALSPEDPASIIRPYEGMSPSSARGYFPGLLTGLVFAGANSPPRNHLTATADPGVSVMTADEVAGLDLSACELAILSACQTGLGKVAGGEGVLGLQRAFHQAGARTVVASLWTVDDAATQELMTLFYENLWQKKLPSLEAMRQAQLSLLRGENNSHPAIKRGPGAVVKSEARNQAKPSSASAHRAEPRLWAGWAVSGSPGR